MFFVLSLLAGCGGATDPSGIWMLTFPYSDGGTECTDSIDENFTVGEPTDDTVVGGTSDWTYTTDTTGSDSFAFAQITTTTDDNGILVLGDIAYPGIRNKDMWVFSWANESTDSAGMEHSSGYSYTEADSTSDSVTITLTLDGDSATGESEGSYVTTTAWTESDEYSRDVVDMIGDQGQIPAADYLSDPERDTAQTNVFDHVDCSGDTCSLTVTSTCGGSNSFTAARTDLEDEDAYDYMMSAGQ